MVHINKKKSYFIVDYFGEKLYYRINEFKNIRYFYIEN